jgi:hypothetical protein
MPQNTTKNILISVALIAFIISSGAFTIYQLAKRQTNTTNNPQTSNQSKTVPNGNRSITSLVSTINSVPEEKLLTVTFDPYICGISITGIVDKPDLIQKLEFIITNKDNSQIKQSFSPKIDESKNFKILVDDKIITDGIYKLEANTILTNQKTESTSTTIEFKKDCGNLIQNSTAISSTISSAIMQISSQEEIKTEKSILVSSSNSQSSDIATSKSEILRKTIEAPAEIKIETPVPTINSSSLSSSNTTAVDNSTNSVRTGGLDFTALFLILTIILSTITATILKSRQTNLSEIFGKK